jgi:hypothetical protein
LRYRRVARLAIARRERRRQTAAMKRATRRPAEFRKPAHWSDAPAPEPRPSEPSTDPLDPTRYGDWVLKGIAVDF